MYEHSKCGQAIKRALSEHNIYYCSIDDFCSGNIEELKKAVEKVNPNVTSADSVAKAVEEVKAMTTKDDVVIVFGSLSFLSLADEAWNR